MNTNTFLKNKSVLLVFLLLVTQSVVAQIMFQSHYGGTADDGGSSVLQTNDGGYLVVGYTESYGVGGRDVYLIKTDENGDILWTRTYGGSANDQASILLSSNDNKYLIVGLTSSFGNGSCDVYAVKIDNNGDIIWTKTYGGIEEDCGYGGFQSNDTIALIVGTTMSYSPVFNSIYVIKINVNGDTLWEKMYYKNTANDGFCIIETSSNGYLITGSTSNVGNNTSRDCFIIKTNNYGDTIWTKTYGGADDDQAFSACLTNDSCYIISGPTKSFGQGGFDIFLMKLNADGDKLWTKTYGGVADDWGGMVQKTIDNGFIITGYTKSYGAGGWDVYLIKTDANGDTLWTRTFGGAGDEWGCSVKQTSDNGYIISGYTNSYGGSYDAFLIKTNEQGIIDFQKIYNSQKNCKVFPNPFKDKIIITLSSDIDISEINLMVDNSIGQKILYKSNLKNNQIIIDLADEPNGLYYLIIRDNNKIIRTEKLIKL